MPDHENMTNGNILAADPRRHTAPNLYDGSLYVSGEEGIKKEHLLQPNERMGDTKPFLIACGGVSLAMEPFAWRVIDDRL